jgi:DNA-binding beta-propeller fold protein YncE
MAFDIYPREHPLELGPNTGGDPQPLKPRLDTGVMIIRVARITPGQAAAPTIALQVGTGLVTAISLTGATSLVAAPDPGAPIVADVDVTSVADDVFALAVLARDGQGAGTFPWALQLTNHDTIPRAFRWVVADSDADSKQAIVAVDPTTHLDAVAPEPTTGVIGVANHGTGDLTFATLAGTDLGSGFTLITVPDRIAPNARGQITVGYRPPTGLPRGGTAFASTAATFATNDPIAGLPGHTEARATLTATTRAPLWNPGDILVADPEAGDGGAQGALIAIDPTTGRQFFVSVGQRFVRPAGVALDAQGNALVADPTGADLQGAVYRVDRVTGEQTVLSASNMFENPTSLVVTPQGRIVVVDQTAFGGTGGLIIIDPTTGAQTKLASGGPLFKPVVASFDPQSGSLIVLNSELPPGGSWLSQVDPQGTATPFWTTNFAAAATPAGLAVDDSGRPLLAVKAPGRAWILATAMPNDKVAKISEGQLIASPNRLRREGADNVVITDWGEGTDPDKPPVDVRVVRIRLSDGNQTQLSRGNLLHLPFDLVVVPAAP